MSTETRSLPVRDCLDMGVSLCGVSITRHPHPVYHVAFRLTMRNVGSSSVQLIGRKWVLKDSNGATRIIEAERVFNQVPVLAPGSVFSYGGCQRFDCAPLGMEVRFFGRDARHAPFITPALVFPRRCLTLPPQV